MTIGIEMNLDIVRIFGYRAFDFHLYLAVWARWLNDFSWWIRFQRTHLVFDLDPKRRFGAAAHEHAASSFPAPCCRYTQLNIPPSGTIHSKTCNCPIGVVVPHDAEHIRLFPCARC